MNMKKQLKRVLFICGLAVLLVSSAFAQDASQPSSIRSDNFTNRRPAGKKESIKYKYVRQDKKTVKRKSVRVTTKTPIGSSKKAERFFDVGVTMWKLRPPRSSDIGYKLPVQI